MYAILVSHLGRNEVEYHSQDDPNYSNHLLQYDYPDTSPPLVWQAQASLSPALGGQTAVSRPNMVQSVLEKH